MRRRLELAEHGIVFVTTSVCDWAKLFTTDRYAEAVICQFAETLPFFNVRCYGWVLMPSHFHALIGMNDLRRLSAFMQTFKSLSSRRVRDLASPEVMTALTKNGYYALWRPRFDDFVLRDEEQFSVKLRYIHQNPVRAGLARSELDWKWSSASVWNGRSTGPIAVETDLGTAFDK